MTDNTRLVSFKSPVLTGLFFLLFLLSACSSKLPPEEITNRFWTALSANDISAAKQYVTQDSYTALNTMHGLDLKHAKLQFGEIRINGQNASVITDIIYQTDTGEKPNLRFKTFLLRKSGQWKVDYQQTLINIPGKALSDLFTNLQQLGKIFSRQLQQQLPAIEEQIEEFSKQLNEQIEEFNRELEKSIAPEQQDPYADTI